MNCSNGTTGKKNGLWNNVEDIVDASLCMGCGVCEPVCPVRCIEIGESGENGQLIPLVDQETCVSGCDVCLRVCPGEEVDFRKLNEKYIGRQPERADVGVVERTYVGYTPDGGHRFSSSSGGTATALLAYLLDEDIIDGAIVVRMNPERPAETEVVVARTREEILESRGSKYCPAETGVGLRAVMREPGRYAFVGLSCHVHGARKFQEVFRKYRDRIVVTLGLFCGGGITKQGTRFVLETMGVEEGELKELTLRGEGWPGKTTAATKDGRRVELNKRAGARDLKEAAAYNSWMHRYFFPPRCLTCSDLAAQLADISFGDPWLPRYTKTEKVGLSMMVARSAMGLRLLEMAIAAGAIEVVDEMTPQEVVDSQGKIPIKTRLRPYRIAARMLGMRTPEYHGLYEEGSAGPLAVAGALWEYLRLRLGMRRRLWPVLVRLEWLAEQRRYFIRRWRGRLKRLPGKISRMLRLRRRERAESAGDAESAEESTGQVETVSGGVEVSSR